MNKLMDLTSETKQVKKINILFENLEELTLDIEAFRVLAIHNVSENLVWGAGEPIKYQGCGKLVAIISKDFDELIQDENYGDHTVFERLTRIDDIVSVILLDENGNELASIFVEWWDDCETQNYNQITDIRQDGDLWISISPDNKKEEKVAFLKALQ